MLTDRELINITFLTDIEALVKSFINVNFTKYYKILLILLIKVYKLRLANNIIRENIIYIIRIIYALNDYIEELYYLITSLVRFDIILDIS